MRTIPQARPVELHDVDDSGETILHDDERGQLVVLNLLGATVFELIDGERDLETIIALVCAEFSGVPRDTIAQDVRTFVEDLAARAIVELHELP